MRVPGVAALQLLVALLALLRVLPSRATPRCGPPTDNALPSNSRFAVVLSGGPKTYVPGQTYRVSVEGRREGDVPLKFMGFVLTVEPGEDSGRPQVGHFTLYGDALAKFDERCANTVTHATYLPTAEVQVLWTAPPEGSGCVVFRGAVQETSHTWYADELLDAPLMPRVCEDRQENMDEQRPILEECCACDEAKYEVTFEGLWSRHTHPKDFPADSWVTRFSDVIGASHDVNYRFWEYNGMASEGLKQVAERGATRALETELKAQSEHIRTIIKARGISYPNVTGKTFAVFRVDHKNHLMSLVSMVDPSPDWIVGVSGLELCLSNCSWVDHVQLNLYPFDAGTDSGLTYIAPDQPSRPQEPIRKMSSSFPNDLRSPFFDPSGEPMRPMARLSLVRQRLYEKSCDEKGLDGEDHDAESTNRGMPFRGMQAVSQVMGLGPAMGSPWGYAGYDPDAPDLDGLPPPEQDADDANKAVTAGVRDQLREPRPVDCKLSEWSKWTACDATCGLGYKIKQRTVLVSPQNGGRPCDRKLVSRKRCTRLPPCAGSLVTEGEENPDDDNPWGSSSIDNNPREHDCVMSQWSEWSQCTTTCGINAQQIRSRKIVQHAGPGGRPCGARSEVRSCYLLPCPR